jgi:hypothetical protein
MIFPDSVGWNNIQENQVLSFQIKTPLEKARFSIEGVDGLHINFDTLGNFEWRPSYDLVDRVTKSKDFPVIFQATFADGKRDRKVITFTVHHVNRPPQIEELPIFYVKQSSLNTYQIPSEYVYDPDGDPIVFKSVQSQMPEGANLSSLGQFTWSPSRSQFSSLRNNPLQLDFIVQDQPDKAETKGKLRIAQTQQDLPPEVLIVPTDTLFTIKEDETLNLKIYVSDPNGDDNIKSTGFVSSDTRVPTNVLKEYTSAQYEFTWMPGYYFVEEVKKAVTVELTFYALDKTNNRAQRKIKIKILDTENMLEKDALQYAKYRNILISSLILISQLDQNQKQLNQDYKKARKGKKNRSILNASLGAATGLSPVAFQPDQAKIVSGVGGTTVLTLGTLEATEVVGRSKDAIMDKIKLSIEIRNKIQAQGDEFARKYALKSGRRNPDFEKDIDKLRAALNDQRLVLLELDAYTRNPSKIDNKDIKKTFIDFSEE